MTVAAENPVIAYTGTSTTTVFATTFTVESASQLIVQINGANVTGWTYAAGAVTFATPPAVGAQVWIIRATNLMRDTSYSAYSNQLRPQVIDLDFDRLWRAVQDIASKTGRALTVGLGSNAAELLSDLQQLLIDVPANEQARLIAEASLRQAIAGIAGLDPDYPLSLIDERLGREAADTVLHEMIDDINAVNAAQDAAIYGATAGAKSYLTLANLTASPAPAANTLAYVSNDSTSANNGMYTYSGSAWIKSLYDPVSKLVALDAAFTTVAGKNKFDPALALDGYYNPYNNGIDQAFANGITFGRQNVVAGETYTLWLPTAQVALDPVLRCYDANNVFLGNHIPLSTNPVPALPPTGVVWSDSNHTVMFTIPVGSAVAKIAVNNTLAAHTSTQFNDAVNSMQLELGSVKTAYEPYTLAGNKLLKEDRLPYEYLRKSIADALYATKSEGAPPALIERAKSTMVMIDGTYAYIRTKWNATLDLVQRVSYGTSTAFNNNVVNPYDVRTIPASTAASNTITAYPSGTLIVSQVDDAAPCQYNFTYIGANHGPAILHQVTVTGHGKTTVDVGSRWTQGANTFTLMRIVDANTLWLVSQNVGTTYWSFVATSQTGLAFTHAAGATNTAGFTPSADTVGTQLYPAIRNHTRLIKLDGITTVSAAGIYYAEFVDIVNSYDICNPVSTIAYVQSQVGSVTQPSFTDPSISSDMRVVLTYRYASNGSLTVNQSYQCKAALRMNYLGGIQALPLSYAGKSIFQYVPRLNPIIGSLKTWNLSATEDITSQVETLTFTTATWSDANNPPDKYAQIIKTSGVKNHGFVMGFGLQRGNSVPAVRKLGVASDAGFLNASTRKMYPKLVTNSGFTSNMTAVGDVITTVAYRCFYNFDALPNATVYTWYYDGDDIIVVFDIHESVTALTLPLPSWMQGKSATVIDASASFSLKTPTVVDDGLLVTVTAGYGFASIKLR